MTNPPSQSQAIVIAAHGIPPSDYPGMKVGMLMMLEIFSDKFHWGFLENWHHRLDEEVRHWKRTPKNDPYKIAVENLAEKLSDRLGMPVFVGYNEFCSPTVMEAIEQAISHGATSIQVVSTMLIRGNTHTESEIAESVNQAALAHPNVNVMYAFPVNDELIVTLLESHLKQFQA